MIENRNSLKPGWRKVKFGDVVQLAKVRTKDPIADGFDRYVGLDHLEPGNLRIRRWGNVADGVTFNSVFQPGQVLFGKRRAYQRKVATADFAGVCSGDIYVLESRDPDVLLPALLPFLCQTDAFFEHAVGTSAGSLSPRTNWSSLADFKFALPSLMEQEKIRATMVSFSKLDEAYVTANAHAEVLLRAGSIKAFSSQKLDLVPFERVLKRQPQSGLYKGEEFLGRGAKFVNMRELFGFDKITDSIEMKRVELSEEEVNKYALTPNDLLFGRRSIVLEGAGKCALVSELKEPTVFESSILRVTLDSTIVLPGFIFEWLRSPRGIQQISRIRSFTTIAGIAGTDLKRIMVPLMPILDQLAIIDELSSLGSSVNRICDRQSRNRELQKQTLEQCLGGKSVH